MAVMLNDLDILYVTHRLPYPPAGGARVRAFHCTRHLARRNRVTVAVPTRSAEEDAAVPALAELCEGVLSARITPLQAAVQSLASASTGQPASLGYFYSATLARAIRQHLRVQPVDLIVVHCSSVAPYVAWASDVPKVLDFVDMDSQKWIDYRNYKRFPLAQGYAMEGHNLARAEVRLARAFDLCLCATPFERDTLLALAGEVPAEVVPNGVDLDHFGPGEEAYDRDRICFVGRMDYYPNEQCMVEFCRDVLPLIRAQRPRTSLSIVGAEPTSAVRALAALDGVSVTGTVDDVRPHVRRAALSVAPLRIARGTQNKVLESMAMGVPVVASPLAARGVDAVPGEHLLTADGPDETAGQVLRLLSDDGERRRLARAGRARVEQSHAWPAALERFEWLVAAETGVGEVTA